MKATGIHYGTRNNPRQVGSLHSSKKKTDGVVRGIVHDEVGGEDLGEGNRTEGEDCHSFFLDHERRMRAGWKKEI